MYGLKQAGKFSNNLLAEQLQAHKYYQCTITPGLRRHTWQQVMFVLFLDNFGVKYICKADADHLHQALQQLFTVATDWTGSKFACINIQWDYLKQTSQTNMDGYIANVCTRFARTDLKKLEHSPHKHQPITYGAKEQYANNKIDTRPKLDAKGIKRMQSIIGALLYYGQAVDNKLLLTLNSFRVQQAATNTLITLFNKFLN